MWAQFSAWCDRLVNEQMLFRRGVLVWAVGMITVTTGLFMMNPAPFQMHHIPVLMGIQGLMTLAINWYFKKRADEENYLP